jgi:hypothetical protein
MKPKHQKPLIALAFAALALTTHTSHAAVSFVAGSLTNDVGAQISSWSLSTVTKTRDIGIADNRYGTDGYAWMNTANDSGGAFSALANVAQSTPNYPSDIAYIGATTGTAASFSASFNGADDRLLANGTGSANVGYVYFAPGPWGRLAGQPVLASAVATQQARGGAGSSIVC